MGNACTASKRSTPDLNSSRRTLLAILMPRSVVCRMSSRLNKRQRMSRMRHQAGLMAGGVHGTPRPWRPVSAHGAAWLRVSAGLPCTPEFGCPPKAGRPFCCFFVWRVWDLGKVARERASHTTSQESHDKSTRSLVPRLRLMHFPWIEGAQQQIDSPA